MIEEIYRLTQGSQKTVEKVLTNEDIHLMHMVLNRGEGLPEHFSNAKNIYMTVLRGKLSICLDNQPLHEYESGTLPKIPFHTKMNVQNLHPEVLELIVVKAPAPNNQTN